MVRIVTNVWSVLALVAALAMVGFAIWLIWPYGGLSLSERMWRRRSRIARRWCDWIGERLGERSSESPGRALSWAARWRRMPHKSRVSNRLLILLAVCALLVSLFLMAPKTIPPLPLAAQLPLSGGSIVTDIIVSAIELAVVVWLLVRKE